MNCINVYIYWMVILLSNILENEIEQLRDKIKVKNDGAVLNKVGSEILERVKMLNTILEMG